jgi:hypothetical protein
MEGMATRDRPSKTPTYFGSQEGTDARCNCLGRSFQNRPLPVSVSPMAPGIQFPFSFGLPQSAS